MPRILCLPGFLQSGNIFAEKSSGIRKILSKKLKYDLDYIDPPVVISNKEQLPFRLSLDADEEKERWDAIVAQNLNRCWWHSTTEGMFDGIEDSIKHVLNHIEQNGPYDGIIGFSQGAALSAILANTVEKAVPTNGPLSVAVLFSPFAFTIPKNAGDEMTLINSEITDVEEYSNRVKLDPRFSDYFTSPSTTTKMVFVCGKEDVVVPPVRTAFLSTFYPSVEMIEHDGGHYVPNKKSFLNPVVESIKSALESKPTL